MPAISSDNQAVIRRSAGAIDPVFLLIPPLTVAGTALVAGTPDYDSPVYEIAIDNASADFEANTDRGAIVRITHPSTGALKYEGTLRQPPTTTLISIEAIREGDTGTPQLFGQSIADNDVVTIYVQHGAGTSLSFLDPADSELYKRRNLPFDTAYPQSQYPEVLARIGSHRHARVAEGAEASLSFTDNSYDFIAQTLERTWHPPASWTQTTGTSTSATAVYDVPAGNYLIEMTASRVGGTEATDSNRAFRYVFVTDGPDGDNPAFSDLFKVVAIESTQDRIGRTDTYTIQCNAGDETTLLTYLYPGAFCLLQETPRHSADNWASEGTATAGEVDHFCGHLRRYERVGVDSNGIQTWRITFESWLKYMAALPMPTQVFRVATPPTKWYEAHPDCMDIGCILWMWIFFHSDMGRFYDIYFEDVRAFHRPRIAVDAGTLLGSFQQIMAQVTGGNIGCASSGALYARRHGSYETDTDRDAIPVVWTWGANDLEAGIEVARDALMKVGQLVGGGLISSTSTDYDAYKAEAGYLAQAQAPGRQQINFTAFSASDVQARVGHAWQHVNRPVEFIPVSVLGVRDVIDPALMEWHRLNVGTYAPLEKEAFGTTRRVLPLAVTRSYALTPYGVIKRISAQFEPETKGKPAPLVSLTGGEGAELGDPLQPLPAVEVTTPEEDPCSEDYGYDWCHEIDFTASNQGFAEIAADGGVYTGASGWEAEKSTFGYEVRVRGGVQKSVATAINTTCKRIEAVITHTDGQGSNFFYVVFGNSTANLTSAMPVGSMQVGAWTGSINGNGVAMLKIRFQTATRSTIPASDPNPLGAFTLHKLRLWGNGTEPSW